MPAGWIDMNGNGIFDEGDEIVIIRDQDSSSPTQTDESYGSTHSAWALGALFGGTYIGWESGIAATEGFSALAEAGIIGAEYGALAGPIGIVAGAAVGVASAYVIYNYHEQILGDLF